MLKKIILFTPILFLFLITNVSAASCNVEVGPGKQYSSIQSGINAAGTGQTVCVYYGIYSEEVKINKQGLTLLGISDSQGSRPVIDGQYKLPSGQDATGGKCPGLVRDRNGDFKECYKSVYGNLVDIRSDNVTLQNFTIKNSLGRGVQAYSTSGVTIANNYISESRSSSINLETVVGTNVINNTLTRAGTVTEANVAASILDWPGTLGIKDAYDTNVEKNKIFKSRGEGVLVDTTRKNSKKTRIIGNHIFDVYSSHVYLHGTEDVQVRNNFIYHSKYPEYDRWTDRDLNVSNCINSGVIEPQFSEKIGLKDIIIENNLLIGCGKNIGLAEGDEGKLVENITIKNNTLYTPNNNFQNYFLPKNTNYQSNIIVVGNLVIGNYGVNNISNTSGEKTFSSLQQAGINYPSGELERDVSPKSFINSTGFGADISKIPDINEVGAGSENTNPKPTVATPTPTLSITNKYDVTGEGNVDILDIIDVIKHIFGS